MAEPIRSLWLKLRQQQHYVLCLPRKYVVGEATKEHFSRLPLSQRLWSCHLLLHSPSAELLDAISYVSSSVIQGTFPMEHPLPAEDEARSWPKPSDRFHWNHHGLICWWCSKAAELYSKTRQWIVGVDSGTGCLWSLSSCTTFIAWITFR